LPGWSAEQLKQVKINDKSFNEFSKPTADVIVPKKHTPSSSLFEDMDLRNLKSNILWDVLVETARRSPLYSNLTGYIRTEILPRTPNITPRELASKLSISFGEALVILADSLE